MVPLYGRSPSKSAPVHIASRQKFPLYRFGYHNWGVSCNVQLFPSHTIHNTKPKTLVSFSKREILTYKKSFVSYQIYIISEKGTVHTKWRITQAEIWRGCKNTIHTFARHLFQNFKRISADYFIAIFFGIHFITREKPLILSKDLLRMVGKHRLAHSFRASQFGACNNKDT